MQISATLIIALKQNDEFLLTAFFDLRPLGTDVCLDGEMRAEVEGEPLVIDKRPTLVGRHAQHLDVLQKPRVLLLETIVLKCGHYEMIENIKNIPIYINNKWMRTEVWLWR